MRAWTATTFFMDIFGGWHLSTLVSDIIPSRCLCYTFRIHQIGRLEFFDELPSILTTEFGGQHVIPNIISSVTREEKTQVAFDSRLQSINATFDNEVYYLTFASKLKSKVFGVEACSFTYFSPDKRLHSPRSSCFASLVSSMRSHERYSELGWIPPLGPGPAWKTTITGKVMKTGLIRLPNRFTVTER